MLATREIVEAVTGELRGFDGPVVVDPVMVAATGDRLLSSEAEAAYDDLIASATLVTPNADEAAILVDGAVETPADAAAAGRTLVDRGADAALVKGGHLTVDGDDAGRDRDPDGDAVVDTLVIAAGSDDEDPRVRRIENPRIDAAATHGSGCTLSSAIAARLARGEPLEPAVVAAVDDMGAAIGRGYDVGAGPGAVNPTATDAGE
jgi:hydroxymethylpyrimidine/phosphomethylpyrimidine kinase